MPLSDPNSFQRHVLKGAAIIFLVECAFVSCLIPPRVIHDLIDRERTQYTRDLGPDAEHAIHTEADKLFKSSAIDTGFRDTSFRFMIGQWNEGDSRDGISLDDRGVKQWEERQLKSCWGSFYLALYRYAAIFAWLPYILPITLAACAGGLFRWRIGQWQFSFASPVRHAAALHLIAVLIVIGLCMPVIPVPLSALIAPTLLFVASLMAWVTLSNLPKKF